MEENKKLLSLTGILGRRNFIINYLIISVIIDLIFSTPILYGIFYVFLHPEKISFLYSPIFGIWILIGIVLSVAFYYSIIVRRVRDILPSQSDLNIYMLSLILPIFTILASLHISGYKLFSVATLVLLIMLICLKGESSKQPKNEVVKFNWGAFLGTWLWGLFNKTPITLLMIPLFFTTAALPFSIICGLKGNEWAYKNAQADDLEKFHANQKKQTIIWSILSPIIAIVMAFASLGLIANLAEKYVENHPDFAKQLEQSIENYQEDVISSVFNEIVKEGDEYQFYLDPKVWNKMSDKNKEKTFKMGALYVIMQNPNATDLEKQQLKMKIYSSFNKEVLAEYSEEKLEDENGFKTYKEYFRFNTRPSIP
ncbi:hypothetical protein IJ579_05400 [bacterium]|nr:hypothetical protein [bacterium]